MLIDQAAEMGMNEVVNAKGQITDMEGLNKALFALMEERFKGGMAMQAQTFKGMVSNARDAMGTMARELSRPVFDRLKIGLSAILPTISAFTAFVKGDMVNAGSILFEAYGYEKQVAIMNFFEALKGGVLAVIGWFKQFGPAVQNLGAIFMNLLPIGQLIGGALAFAIAKMASALPPVLNLVTSLVAKFTEWEGFVPIVMGLVAGFLAFRTVFFVQGLITGITTAIRSLQLAMTAIRLAILAVNSAFLANPIAWVVALLAGLVAALVVAYQHSETFRTAVNNLWAGVKSAWQATVNFFVTTVPVWIASMLAWFRNLGLQMAAIWFVIRSQAQSAWQSVISGIVGILSCMWSRIQPIIQPFITFFVNTWQNLKMIVLGIIGVFLNAITGNFNGLKVSLLAIVTGLKNQFIAIWILIKTTVLNVITGLKNGLVNGFNAAKTGAINAINGLQNGVVNTFNNIKLSVSSATSNAKKAIVDGFNSAKTSAVNAAKGMYDGIVSWVKSIPGKFTEMKNNIISTIKGINLKTLGSDMVDGFADGISNAIGKVKRKVREMASGVTAELRGMLKISSPSRVTREYGEWTGEGFVIGLDNWIKSTVAKAREFALAASENMQFSPSGLMGNMLTIGRDLFLTGFAEAAGAGGTTHNHYWNVKADEIDEVQKVIRMVEDLRMERRKR